MSLTTIITSLDAEFTRRARRNRPQTRWAETHPALYVDLPELRRQLADWRSDDGRTRFAELVDLARRGDNDAATLVTINVLPTMERYERRCFDRGNIRANTRVHDYDTLAGAVWQALIASRSYKPAHLREDIIRQAWLITRRRTIGPFNETPVCLLGDTGSFAARLAWPTTPNHDHDVACKTTLADVLDKLSADGQLTDRGRAVLESIADDRTGGYYSRGHDRAFAQYRLRLVRPLRTNTELLDALTA